MTEESSVRIEIVEPEDRPGLALDAALRGAARRHSGTLALIDPPNRPALGAGEARFVTYADADRIVGRIAGHLRSRGLVPGDVVALQLPNLSESVLMLYGCWRAGLIACPLSLMWRENELHHALPQINPRAVVTFGAFASHDHAETLRQAVARHMSVRHIFGLGTDVHDGITPIAPWFDMDPPAAPSLTAGEAGEDRTAVMTWAASPSGPYPVPRRHKELAALASAFAGELGLTARDTVLNAYPLTAVHAVAQFCAAVKAGARTALHAPFDYGVFVRQLNETGATYTAVPAAVIDAMDRRNEFRGPASRLARIGCVWPAPHIASRAGEPPLPVFDIHALGEIGVFVRARRPGMWPRHLPLGKWNPRGAEAGSAPCIETRVRGTVRSGTGSRTLAGNLLIRGAGVPHAPFTVAGALAEALLVPDAQGFLDTGFHARVDEQSPGSFVCDRSPEIFYHGGTAVAASELDRLYSDYPGFLDAAAFALEDPVMGERIFAAVIPRPDLSLSLETFRLYLAGKGVAPFKAPDRIVVVRSIPRRPDGTVVREGLLSQV
ncbi:MAG: class I adenylate-forming enzyme family protein [Hyphomicrobiales bacterium]